MKSPRRRRQPPRPRLPGRGGKDFGSATAREKQNQNFYENLENEKIAKNIDKIDAFIDFHRCFRCFLLFVFQVFIKIFIFFFPCRRRAEIFAVAAAAAAAPAAAAIYKLVLHIGVAMRSALSRSRCFGFFFLMRGEHQILLS